MKKLFNFNYIKPGRFLYKFGGAPDAYKKEMEENRKRADEDYEQKRDYEDAKELESRNNQEREKDREKEVQERKTYWEQQGQNLEKMVFGSVSEAYEKIQLLAQEKENFENPLDHPEEYRKLSNKLIEARETIINIEPANEAEKQMIIKNIDYLAKWSTKALSDTGHFMKLKDRKNELLGMSFEDSERGEIMKSYEKIKELTSKKENFKDPLENPGEYQKIANDLFEARKELVNMNPSNDAEKSMVLEQINYILEYGAEALSDTNVYVNLKNRKEEVEAMTF